MYSNIINNIDNINNNIEFSPYDLSTKVENYCEENLLYEDDVITKCNNGKNDNMANSLCELPARKASVDNSVHIDKIVHVLDKDELRPIYTSDGVVIELPIRNILDGLKYALTNQKNEKVLREISEKCDLTDKQREEVDNTIELWRLGF